MDTALDPHELDAWLALLRAPTLGSTGLKALVARCGSARAALQATAREGASLGHGPEAIAALKRPDAARIALDRHWLEQEGRALLLLARGEYPRQLAECAEAPPALFVDGDVETLWLPQLAIVGSRNASPAGLAIARDFAATLAGAGFCIVSGLASGIDAAAHAAALDAGGRTVAVCATGLDRVYPASNTALAERIRRQGALVSELPLGCTARAHHFPRRNRIIAGLGLGTLVIEASLRSGSLITARLAAEAGREVFAVPGSIHHPLARGCHRLIRDGAKLVETAAEVIEELAAMLATLELELCGRDPGARTGTPARCTTRDEDPDYRRLLEALGHDSLGVDELVARTGFGASAVSSMLLILELDGRLASLAGGRYQRLPT